MVWPLKKREPVGPSQMDIQRAANRAEIVNQENTSTNAEMQAAGGIAFDFQVIDDEKILGLFDPNNDLFCEPLQPLLPLFSRMIFLTNCTLIEAEAYKLSVDFAITKIKNQVPILAEEVLDQIMLYSLLDNLKSYAEMRVNDSIGGFKLIQLTERTKNIKITDVEENSNKKKGWFS